jgi:hypothetical protein
MTFGDPILPARFWQKITQDDDGCWVWGAAVNAHGYGRLAWQGANRFAHRVAYAELVGPIPDGLTLDHLCRNPPCVNPAHLEPVTSAVNILRGLAPPALNARKTHCLNGHALEGNNVMQYGRMVGRHCRACHSERAARYRERKAAA